MNEGHTDQLFEGILESARSEAAEIISRAKRDADLTLATYHKKIAEIANNEFLQQIVGSLFETLGEVLQILPQTIEGWRWHQIVAEHIRNHEPMKASEAMRTLVIASGTRLLPYLNGNRDH